MAENWIAVFERTFKSCFTVFRQKLGEVEEARLVDVATRVALVVSEKQSASSASGDSNTTTPIIGVDARSPSRASSTLPLSQEAETQTANMPGKSSIAALITFM